MMISEVDIVEEHRITILNSEQNRKILCIHHEKEDREVGSEYNYDIEYYEIQYKDTRCMFMWDLMT